jgi:hypothetical protein
VESTPTNGLPATPLLVLPIYAEQSGHFGAWTGVFGAIALFDVLGAIAFHDLGFLLLLIGLAIGEFKLIRTYRGRFAIGDGWVANRKGWDSWTLVRFDQLRSVVEETLGQHFSFGDRLTSRIGGASRPVIVFSDRSGHQAAVDPHILIGQPFGLLTTQFEERHLAVMQPQIRTFLGSPGTLDPN